MFNGRLECLERFTFSETGSQLFRPAELEPLGAAICHLIETLIELHPLVIQVLHRLYKKLLHLANLLLLLARIQRFKLLLQSKGETEQITVVSLQLADDRVAPQNPSRLVPLNQSAQFLMSPTLDNHR